ncbi:unnamed protein product, partial [Sphacelaria rigidula]
MLPRLEQAFLGKYHAEGFSDKEFDMAILALRLRGQALLYALSKSSGFPGRASLRISSDVFRLDPSLQMRFVLCASFDKDCLRHAVKVNLEGILPLFEGRKRIFILQMDGIAVEQRARYYKERDEIVGLCVQHTPSECTEFSGIANLERIQKLLAKKEDGIEIGKECTVISISALGERKYHVFPVVVFSSCK